MFSPIACGRVFAALLNHCPPLGRLERPFDFLEPPPDCFGPIDDSGVALAALRQGFTDRQLLDCGILRSSPKGPHRLAPVLARQGDPIVPVRLGPNLPPCALLVGRRCLPVEQCPMTLALLDAAQAGASSAPLLAVADTRELVLYRAMGVPSTLASGLRPPSLPALQRLADAQEAPAPRLVFLAGSLRQKSARTPAHIRFTLRHLATARECLDFDFSMGAWQLDEDLLTHWKYLLRFRNRSEIAAWLTESEKVFLDFEDLVCPVPVRVAEPVNYVQARRERLNDSRVGPEGLPLLDSQSRFDAALEAFVVEPLLERAILHADPDKRAMCVANAEMTGMLAQLRQNVMVRLSNGNVPYESIKLYLNMAGLGAGSMRAGRSL